jgi:hypothetical protein
MNNVLRCSIKHAKELLKHLRDDDMITITVFDKKNYKHLENKRIDKKNGEKLIEQANSIEYQDNDFFGRLSLYGVFQENITYNLLFCQRRPE